MCKHEVDKLHQRYILKFIQFLSWVLFLVASTTGCSATVTVSQLTCAARMASGTRCPRDAWPLVPGARGMHGLWYQVPEGCMASGTRCPRDAWPLVPGARGMATRCPRDAWPLVPGARGMHGLWYQVPEGSRPGLLGCRNRTTQAARSHWASCEHFRNSSLMFAYVCFVLRFPRDWFCGLAGEKVYM